MACAHGPLICCHPYCERKLGLLPIWSSLPRFQLPSPSSPKNQPLCILASRCCNGVLRCVPKETCPLMATTRPVLRRPGTLREVPCGAPWPGANGSAMVVGSYPLGTLEPNGDGSAILNQATEVTRAKMATDTSTSTSASTFRTFRWMGSLAYKVRGAP